MSHDSSPKYSFQQLFLYLQCRHFISDDIKSLKFTLRKRISKSELDKVIDGRDMVQMMERQDILSEEKLPHVNIILREAGIDQKAVFPHTSIYSESSLISEGVSKQGS